MEANSEGEDAKSDNEQKMEVEPTNDDEVQIEKVEEIQEADGSSSD